MKYSQQKMRDSGRYGSEEQVGDEIEAATILI
jgi:hypothetical protein